MLSSYFPAAPPNIPYHLERKDYKFVGHQYSNLKAKGRLWPLAGLLIPEPFRLKDRKKVDGLDIR